MSEITCTPSIAVTIGGQERVYHALVTTAAPTLDGPSTMTLHASTLADVLQRCGAPQEERLRAGGRQRTLVYRGVVVTTHKRFGLGWFATVSHREIESHEVIVELEDGRVHDVESRVGRSRAA